MIIAILGIALILVIFAFAIVRDYNLKAFSILLFVVTLIVTLCLFSRIQSLNLIDEKIAMYERQNAEIMEDIKLTDALVESQVDLYTENNKRINELMEKEIDGSVARWWLYLGDE